MNINKNWVKAGRISKKEATDIILNVSAHNAGQMGDTNWDDYVQIKIYDKEDSRFLRLTMTPDEAEKLVTRLTSGLSKIKKPAAQEAAQ